MGSEEDFLYYLAWHSAHVPYLCLTLQIHLQLLVFPCILLTGQVALQLLMCVCTLTFLGKFATSHAETTLHCLRLAHHL